MLKILTQFLLISFKLLIVIESININLIDHQFNLNKQTQSKYQIISNKSYTIHRLFQNEKDKNRSTILLQQDPSKGPVFQPKLTELPNDEDYTEIEDYYDYDANSDYNFDTNHINIKKPANLLNTSTNLPPSKWITKNATAPSKFNLNSIFEFVEYILRPTNPSENTIENRFDLNEHDYLNGSDYYFFDDAENSTESKEFDK